MKITVIHGQSHNGSACHFARMLGEKFKPNDREYWDKMGWLGSSRPWNK